MSETSNWLACVAWRFKRANKAAKLRKQAATREEPGGETTKKPPTRIIHIFC